MRKSELEELIDSRRQRHAPLRHAKHFSACPASRNRKPSVEGDGIVGSDSKRQLPPADELMVPGRKHVAADLL
jgi:hypothetical protein